MGDPRFEHERTLEAAVKLSVVIPTLNEVGYLRGTVEAVRAQASRPSQILVVDCGSTDGTPELAVSLGVTVIREAAGVDSRASALNEGARHASGDVLLFLDADTVPPARYDEAMRSALADPRVVGGAFEFRLGGDAFGLRVVEAVNRLRYRVLKRYYGDQGVFARAESFRRVGGFPRRRILESSDFCVRLRGVGRLVLVRQAMTTSPRRFLNGGIYRTLALDARIWWLDFLGRPTESFASAYWQENVRRGERSTIPLPPVSPPSSRRGSP